MDQAFFAITRSGLTPSRRMSRRLSIVLAGVGMMANSTLSWSQAVDTVDYRAMRVAAEANLREGMVDPSSAQFSWPTGFKSGTFSTPVMRALNIPPANGLVACGRVNAKNRFGGYVGERVFVVVMSRDGKKVSYSSIDDQVPGINMFECTNWQFPDPQKGMLADSQITGAKSNASVADGLEKLAKLRQRGIITQAEFNAQKQRILSHN